MFRSILIHLEGREADTARLAVASALARPAGAAMTALFVEHEPETPVAVLGRGASASYLAAATEALDEIAAASRHHLAGLDVVWDRERGDAAEILARRGRTSDLLVLGAARAELALATGGPVLVVPDEPVAPAAGSCLVAWDGSAQAARAIRDSLPLLREAREVTAAVIAEKERSFALLNALLPWLERHGIDAAPHAEDARSPGEALLRLAAAGPAGLLVMGAYGRPRWGDLIFGSTTRHVLDRVRVPVLLAH